jgi:hypothetical protein
MWSATGLPVQNNKKGLRRQGGREHDCTRHQENSAFGHVSACRAGSEGKAAGSENGASWQAVSWADHCDGVEFTWKGRKSHEGGSRQLLTMSWKKKVCGNRQKAITVTCFRQPAIHTRHTRPYLLSDPIPRVRVTVWAQVQNPEPVPVPA